MNYPLIGLFLLVGLLLASFLYLGKSSSDKYRVLNDFYLAAMDAKTLEELQAIKSALITWSDEELQYTVYRKHLQEACRILQYIDDHMKKLTGATHE